MARIYLNDFEHLNTTTQSIYELGDFNVLIILTDGTNLTNWDDVENPEDIAYISEDLFGETLLEGRYKNLVNLKAIVTYGVGNIVSTRDMFSGCQSLVEISTLDSWDVSRIDDVSNMFKGCSSLEDLSALSDWNMSSVIDMSCMFMGCSSLEDISPLKNWNVSHVDDMHYLFSDCTSLKNISALANWDVTNVRDMACMFEFCTSLDDISALKNWRLVNAFNVTALFRGCINLKNISPLSNWDLKLMQNNKSLLSIFSYCTSLKNISPLKDWDISNVNRISGLFEGCSSLKNLSSLKDWDVSNITSFEFLFKNCSELTNISALESWDISSVNSLKSMFNGCTLLFDVSALKDWDVEHIRSMEGMFKNCSSLEDISALADWKISRDTVLDSIFESCGMLEEYPENFKMAILNDYQSNPEAYMKILAGLDESFLKNNNINDFDEKNQFFIVDLCTDESLLAHIADRSQIKSIQRLALEKIADENILYDIALHDHNYDISPSEEPSNGLNFDFFFYNREYAFRKIKNKELLVKAVKESQYKLKGIDYIVDYIESEEEWADIVSNSKCVDVSLFALEKISSEEIFKKIADESDNEEILTRILEILKGE